MNTEQFGDIVKITLPTPFPVGDVNVFLIKGDRLTLIDAGVKTAASFEAFVSGLGEAGYTLDDIEQVVLTHHHPDHIGLLDFFPEDIDIIGHRYCKNWLTRDEEFLKENDSFFRDLFFKCGLPPEAEPMLRKIQSPLKFSSENSKLTTVVQEGDWLPGLGDWRVFEMPGHAQSHLAFLREKDGTLIAGDHILATISSNPLLEPPLIPGEDRPKPQLQYNHSLKKAMELPVDIVYTGHGTEVRNIVPLITRRLERQHERAMSVKEMLREKPLTAFEVCVRLFPAVYKRETGLTMSETVGQLDYLLDIGEAGVQQDDRGSLFYFPL
ncbi:MBL fold metallo-hydrolase [Bacillus aerolatus]|uniref:MBL fold metallo-hydrolase n=1 Tax=Bacillus aerolatus TaxID=2653354 RepID=A0A6I1FVA5_9BACI|nr:MBL fold metallo-hydrolase [Bacillus aerolatus]KAB7708843.1 MBL fold metallo-hydrolase [Bacillus aerolatus]